MASTSRSDTATGTNKATLARAIEILDGAAADPGAAKALDPRTLQDLLAAATRLYAAKVESGDPVSALSVGGAAVLPTATEVLVTVSALLESAHVEPFELGLWQATRGGGFGAS